MLKIIKTEQEYNEALILIDSLLDERVAPDSDKGNQLQLLLLILKDYEDKHYAIPLPDAIDSIKMTMKERGLKNKDLVPLIGSKGYVSQLLNRKKSLTADIMRVFHQKLGIPAEILLS